MMRSAISSAARAVPRHALAPQAAHRAFAASSTTSLKDRIEQLLPQKLEFMNKLKKEHSDKVVDKVTIGQVLGGARSVKCMVWETSLLDAQEGIRFRGHTIPDLQKSLPAADGGDEPLPEGLLWLLMTGDIPTKEQARSVTAELHARSKLPAHVESCLRSLPKEMHPMTQLATGILSLQTDSKFAQAYRDGAPKSDYWRYTLDDSLNLLARLPRVAALIYRNKFHDGKIADYDSKLDYSANFSRMLGFTNKDFDDLMRLYLVIHSDHEGGNASAHATHLVGSTLSDPYLSLTGGMAALAGPLHGLANQEVLRWILDLQEEFEKQGKPVNADTIREFAWNTLNAGKVIPGYGHAVLRQTDPRYTAQRTFALKHMPDDPLFKIVSTVYEVLPDVLTQHGKTKNPWPNVDSHSGVLLWHYGLREFDYYTVLFGVSRAFGVLSQLLWDRALGLPLERPKSVTPEWLAEFAAKQ